MGDKTETGWVLMHGAESLPVAMADDFDSGVSALLRLCAQDYGLTPHDVEQLSREGRLKVDLRDNDWWVMLNGLRLGWYMTRVEKFD